MGADQTQRDEPRNIEEIVREVFARLQLEGSNRDQKAVNPDGGKFASGHGTLTLTERLITVATLTDRLASVTQCVAMPRAVVTPAARDLLRDRRVTLTFAAAETGERPAAPASGTRRVMLAVADGKFDPEPLAAALGRDRINIEIIATAGLLAAIDAVSAAVGAANNDHGANAMAANQRAKIAMVFTRETPAAACLANRIPGVRAAAAGSTRDARNAVRSVGANVLMIDPAESCFWELLQMAKVFAAGPRQCPAAWKERLI